MHGAEIELKFPVEDPQPFAAAIESLDLRLETERTFEQNTLYDTPERSLRGQGQLLRLRTYGSRCTVTHKRQPPQDATSARYKTRIETESIVEDCEALAEIFRQLGYIPVFRYEKFRTEWAADNGSHVVLDETPIGTWAELEGAPAWIDSIVAQLGIAQEATTTLSYGKLFLAWRDLTASSADHMTFELCNAPAAEEAVPVA